MKVLSLFSGIGAFEKALDNLKVNCEIVGFSEIDKFASKSYCAIHNVGGDLNLGDIKNINTKDLPKKIDLVTYGFPCQDISVAGKLKGFTNEEGLQTRSGLFFEALRIIKDLKPKIAIAENVRNLCSKRFKNEFECVLKSLEEVGYNNYYQILNAKDYGIPQNRERVFIISIRKDIDTKGYTFPQKMPLELRLKDMLEDNVDEKYFLSQKMIDGMSRTSFNTYKLENKLIDKNGVAKTIIARYEGTPQLVKVDLKRGYSCEVKEEVFSPNGIDIIGNYSKSNFKQTSIVGKNGIAPTVTENHGQVTAIAIKNNTKQGYLLAEEGDAVDISGRMEWHRGTVQKGRSHTITTVGGDNVGVVVKDEPISLTCREKPSVKNNLRIRKLTPKECWRLMGFTDQDIVKVKEVGISDAQLYKQAGNSIVVNVLVEIFKELKSTYPNIFK